MTARTKFILGYRLLLLILSTIGISLELLEDGWGMLLYYTVQSNILVWVFLYYTLWTWRNRRTQEFYRIKAGVTMAILITFVVYHVLLSPSVDPENFYTLKNLLVHYLVPLAFVLDTLVWDRARQYRLVDPWIWTSFPIFYLAFALLNGLVLKWPIPGADHSPFAYFFLDVTEYGWVYVLQYAAIIFVAYLLVGYLLFAFKNKIWQKSGKIG